MFLIIRFIYKHVYFLITAISLLSILLTPPYSFFHTSCTLLGLIVGVGGMTYELFFTQKNRL